MTDRLTDAIRVILDEAHRRLPDHFEEALDAAADDLSDDKLKQAEGLESLVNGIRWGMREHNACDCGGSTILHVRAPKGVRITHEWRDVPMGAIGRASVMQTVREAMGEAPAPAGEVEGLVDGEAETHTRVATAEEQLSTEILAELERARAKFPGDNVTLLALMEEVGELAKASFEESRASVRKEAVQVAVMAMRVVLDGDTTLDDWRERKGLDALTGGGRHD